MLQDIRHALRVLLQAKGWTIVVLLSLTLGIGANTTLFSAVNGLLIRTLSVDDPDGLVRLRWYGDNDMVHSSSEYGYAGETAEGQRLRTTFSHATFEALREGNRTLTDLFAAAPYWQVNVVVDGQAEIASGFIVSGGYFEVLGIGATVGRTIVPDDDRPGAPPAVVLSHGYWQRRFGRDPAAVGKSVTVNNLPATIVGVLPVDYQGFQGPFEKPADVHFPLVLDGELSGRTRLSEPTWWWLQVMGRLKPGVTPAQVRGNLEGVFQAAARAGFDEYLAGLSEDERQRQSNEGPAVPRLAVDSGRRGVFDPDPDVRRGAALLGGVVLLVLLIVCANVANLLLSRATARRPEIAVRLSMGATRWRLVRQLVTESVLLALLGGLLGLWIAFWGRRLLPVGQDVPFDGRVFSFVALLSLLTGVTFSLVPALRATRVDLSASLKDQSRGVAAGRSRLSRALLVVQVAVSLVLLMGAGLFLGTLRNLRQVDVGFDPTNVLLFRLDPTLSGYGEDRLPVFYDEVRERVAAVAGVRSVSLSRATFLAGSTSTRSVFFPGADDNRAHVMTVSPEFFETLGIRLLAGRVFSARDGREAPRVAVLNKAAVREFLDGGQAIGTRFGYSSEDPDEVEIIGVVADTKYRTVRDAAPPTVFEHYLQRSIEGMTFEVKTAIDPRSLVPQVREAVRAVDPNVPVMNVSTQAQEIENRLREERFFALATALFGGLAMVLAAVGLFGLASYDVARRTHEIGVRMALGARRGDVARLVLGESLRLVAVGVVLGVLGALAAGRVIRSQLFGVTPTDAVTMIAAVAVLMLVSALAAYLPARRASRVDPMRALQYE